MTFLGWYVFIGLPLILVAMAYGLIRLIDRDARELDARKLRERT